MKTVEKRFLEKVIKTENCWIWTGARHGNKGYGSFGWDGKVGKAHRFSYCNYKGIIPKGLCVMHTCDNTMCVNPDHLILGTHKENMIDRDAKGRQAKLQGSANGNAKLTANQVRAIRNEYIPNSVDKSLSKLAKRYGVSKKLVLNIVKDKAWKHII